MKKILLVFFFIGFMNGQMETGNDLFTALNSVNDIEKNYGKYFIAGFVTGHWSTLKGLNPYNEFEQRHPNDIKYNIFSRNALTCLPHYINKHILIFF